MVWKWLLLITFHYLNDCINCKCVGFVEKLLFLQTKSNVCLVNTTCRGLCPRAKGYYIGLKRFSDESNQTKWIWSNNVTWTQTETSVNLLRLKPKISSNFFSSVIISHIQMQILSVISTKIRKSQYGIKANRIIIKNVKNAWKFLRPQIDDLQLIT